MAFPGTGTIWMNGTLVEWKDATIHVASHVIHYGSAVFEGARCYETPRGSACFRLDAHMQRLQHSPRSTGWSIRSISPAGRTRSSTRFARTR
jgi:branched-chain amino acid aminotransferase